MQVDTIEQWNEIARQLSERGYSLYQTQYGIDDPHGYIARFLTIDNKYRRLEFNTFDPQVRDAMQGFKV